MWLLGVLRQTTNPFSHSPNIYFQRSSRIHHACKSPQVWERLSSRKNIRSLKWKQSTIITNVFGRTSGNKPASQTQVIWVHIRIYNPNTFNESMNHQSIYFNILFINGLLQRHGMSFIDTQRNEMLFQNKWSPELNDNVKALPCIKLKSALKRFAVVYKQPNSDLVRTFRRLQRKMCDASQRLLAC